jgi:hypothetical protein
MLITSPEDISIVIAPHEGGKFHLGTANKNTMPKMRVHGCESIAFSRKLVHGFMQARIKIAPNALPSVRCRMNAYPPCFCLSIERTLRNRPEKRPDRYA